MSCLCSTRQILQCQCYQAQAFDFKVNSAVPALHQGQPDLEVQWDRDDIVGQWCVIRYDDEVYPGTIVEVSETHVHVKCMHRVGHNRYYWPMREDALWYPFEDVLRLIPAPQHVTARHVEIKRDVWEDIAKSYLHG